MSTQTTTRLVTLPQVNLLPPEIEQERRFRRTQFGLGAVVVASLGVVGVLFLAANSQVSSAQGELADSQRETTRLEARAAEVGLILHHGRFLKMGYVIHLFKGMMRHVMCLPQPDRPSTWDCTVHLVPFSYVPGNSEWFGPLALDPCHP